MGFMDDFRKGVKKVQDEADKKTAGVGETFAPGPPTDGSKKKGWFARLSTGKQIGVVVGGLLTLVILIAIGSSEEETSSPKPEQSEAVTVRSFDEQLESVVLESVEENGPVTVWCRGPECRVFYEVQETGGFLLSPQEAIFEEQRRIWRKLFSRPETEEATILVDGPVVSVGGKESVKPILRTTCDRQAANQINWENVQLDGIETLCDQIEFVNFD